MNTHTSLLENKKKKNEIFNDLEARKEIASDDDSCFNDVFKELFGGMSRSESESSLDSDHVETGSKDKNGLNTSEQLSKGETHQAAPEIKISPSHSIHSNGAVSMPFDAGDNNKWGAMFPVWKSSRTETEQEQENMERASSQPKLEKREPFTPDKDDTWDFSLQSVHPNFKSKRIWLEGSLYHKLAGNNKCLHEMHKVSCPCGAQKRMPICRLCSQPFCSSQCFKSNAK